MSKEYEILEHLNTDQDLSQRRLAEKTGLSLGMVNILLQRMVKKGLVKVERLNARSLRYMLTPKGLAEKSKLTYRYIKSSYEYILKISDKVRDFCEQAEKLGIKRIYLYGPQNEVYHIIKLALDKEKIPYSYIEQNNRACVRDLDQDQLIMVWELADEEKLAGSYQVVNILKIL